MLLPPPKLFLQYKNRFGSPDGSSGARNIFGEEKSRLRPNVALRAGLTALADGEEKNFLATELTEDSETKTEGGFTKGEMGSRR